MANNIKEEPKNPNPLFRFGKRMRKTILRRVGDLASAGITRAYDINHKRKVRMADARKNTNRHIRKTIIMKSESTQHIPEDHRKAIVIMDSFYQDNKAVIDFLFRQGKNVLRLWVWYILFTQYDMVADNASLGSKTMYRGLQFIVVVDVLTTMSAASQNGNTPFVIFN